MAHSWVVWTLPVSKIVVRALSRERRWECGYSGDFTKPCLFHAIVDQMKILRSSRGGEGPSPLSLRRSLVVSWTSDMLCSTLSS